MHLPRSGSTHPGPQRAALSCNVIHPGSSSVSADNGPRTDAAGHTVLSSGEPFTALELHSMCPQPDLAPGPALGCWARF